MKWDPNLYKKFLKERTQPAQDLIAHIQGNPKTILDMGCGPGNSTFLLFKKFPKASIWGIDSSEDMLSQAKLLLPNIPFLKADMTTFLTDQNVDLCFSNAALQWADNPLQTLKKWANITLPKGQLAVQFPINFKQPTHLLIHKILKQQQMPSIKNIGKNLPSPLDIQNVLHQEGFKDINIWDTTYYHQMNSYEEVITWMQGTGLRRIESGLSRKQYETFMSAYRQAIFQAYPLSPFLFPFARRFIWAKK